MRRVTPLLDAPLRMGLLLGVVFGVINLLFSWLRPLSDDSVAAVSRRGIDSATRARAY
jgi:hypothetical protein